jgi:tetratricopeptide (TPR) repeat protein
MFAFAQFFTLKRQLMLFIGSFVCIFLFHYWFGFAGSWLPFLIALFLGVKYVILGTVNGAVMEMQMGNFPEAEKILGWTRFPHWLRFGYHGVFYMLKSQMAFQRGDHNSAESYAEKALSLDLQDDMKAGLYLELVNIYGMRKNVPKVKEFMQKAKKLNITVPQIRDKFKEVELMLEGKHESQQRMQQQARYTPPPFSKRGKR